MNNVIERKKPQRLNPSKVSNKLQYLINSIDKEVETNDIEYTVKLANKLVNQEKDTTCIDSYNLAEKKLILLSKFTLKAVNEGLSEVWLELIEQILEESQSIKFENNYVRFEAYLSIYRCLNSISHYSYETENIVKKAIDSSPDNLSKVKANLILAQYYQDLSYLPKMKDILDRLSNITNDSKNSEFSNNDESELCIARISLLYGQYYFYIRNLKTSRKYFVISKQLLETLYSKTNSDLVWKFKDFSICLHYIGRIDFECQFYKSSLNFYEQSQNQLEIATRNFSVERAERWTACNHLRKGQSKFKLKDFKGAKEEFEIAYKIFFETGDMPSICQVELAQVDLIAIFTHEDNKDILFSKIEEKLSYILEKSCQEGYDRIYLVTALKLIKLYIKHIKINKVIKLLVSKHMLQLLIKKDFRIILASIRWVIGF